MRRGGVPPPADIGAEHTTGDRKGRPYSVIPSNQLTDTFKIFDSAINS